ncbi:electron transfer flavoprotein regulatory factor 1-like [Mizuhopecten yessoensis]|uniref:LYR motif-containing protein 5 n=1 Tax=Mizuhopecten yessoensis TaxID=6573 RepID=A0A210PLI4_MIZYE|nr:electron transfer flavoprotein regulatory factor 1-like [Mizuhopecten yessoensis]OWF37343.1 LYR motif-containing protein 5 [Mizuhopecten yessoensis]
MMAMSQRSRVIQLYKTLLHMGRDYPKGHEYFRERQRNAFRKNRNITDPQEIDALITKGEYVQKEIEALYFLMKYRTMKRRYYDSHNSNETTSQK